MRTFSILCAALFLVSGLASSVGGDPLAFSTDLDNETTFDSVAPQRPALGEVEDLLASTLHAGQSSLLLEQNMGQWSDEVLFGINAGEYQAFVTVTGITFVFTRPAMDTLVRGLDGSIALPQSNSQQYALAMTFVGGTADIQLEMSNPVEYYTNYIRHGSTFSYVPHYREAVISNVYWGIDLRYYIEVGGQLKYDFLVAPGANVKDIRLQFDGIVGLEVQKGGSLLAQAEYGSIAQDAPYTYQIAEQQEMSVPAKFTLLDNTTASIEVGPYDATKLLVIDPLLYSTFLGSSGNDYGIATSVTEDNSAFLVGYTSSPEFPVSIGTFQGNYDLFVTKFRPSGAELAYSTFIGGSGDDFAFGMAQDNEENAFIVGTTTSSNFPMHSAYDSTYGGSGDGFALKLDANGAALAYSTYLGGGAEDSATAVFLDPNGNAYVTGYTHSNDYPVWQPFQATNAGGYDAFLTRLTADGASLSYSTFLGGSSDDASFAVTVDSTGSAHVAGWTASVDFPVVNAAQATFGGGTDMFAMKVSPPGNTLSYSTYIGGVSTDRAYSLGIDSLGQAVVGGTSNSADFHTTLGAYQPSLRDGFDATVMKFNVHGSIRYSTYLGASGNEWLTDLSVAKDDSILLYGQTLSHDFPTTSNAYLSILPGDSPTFLARLSPAGDQLTYSSLVHTSSFGPPLQFASWGGGEPEPDVLVHNKYGVGYVNSPDVSSSGRQYYAKRDVFDTTGDFTYMWAGWINSTGDNIYHQVFGGVMWGGYDTTSTDGRPWLVKINPLGKVAYEHGVAHPNDFQHILEHASANTVSPGFHTVTIQRDAGARNIVVKLDGSTVINANYLVDQPPSEGGINTAYSVGYHGPIRGSTYETRFWDYKLDSSTLATIASTAALGVANFQETLEGTEKAAYFMALTGPTGMVVGPEGDVFLTGYTQSSSLRTTGGAFQPEKGGATDAFLTKMRLPAAADDGFDETHYQPESPTGNTPFSGSAIKPLVPGAVASRSVSLASGEFVATLPVIHYGTQRGEDFTLVATFRSIGDGAGNPAMGWRWDTNWLQYLEASGSNYIHHAGDGRALLFTNAGSSYDGPPGSYARLVPASGKLELQDREGLRMIFDPALSLRLTDVYDQAGNHWVLSYSGTPLKLDTITDPRGREIKFEYIVLDPNPFYAMHGVPILASVAVEGRMAQFNYDVVTGHIESIETDGVGGAKFKTTFLYDRNHRLIEIQDPLDQTYVLINYDEHGRVLSQIRAGEIAHSFKYDHSAGLTTEWDGESNQIEWSFLHQGSSTPRVVPSSKTEYTRGLRSSDPASYVTTMSYNAQDELTRVEFPKGNSIRYEYSETAPFFSKGNLIRETHVPGNTRTTLDVSHFQTSLVREYGYDTTYNVVTSITDERGTGPFSPPNGGTATPSRYTTRIDYDFHEETLGDLNGDTVTNSKDRRPVRITYPTVNAAGSPHTAFTSNYANQAVVEYFRWNSAGQLTWHKDAVGVIETRSYHPSGPAVGYLASITADSGGLDLKTEFSYNGLGQVTQVMSPEGHTYAYTYDTRGRMVQETGPSPSNYRTHWTYDGNDDVLTVERETDAGTNLYAIDTYHYDALGRLVRQTTDATRPAGIGTAIAGQGTPPASTFDVTYTLDGNGRVVKRTGGSGEITQVAYDERGFVLSLSGPDGGTYTYDANGNPVTFVNQRGFTTLYEYDGYDRHTVTHDALGTIFVRHYDSVSNVVRERAFGVGGFNNPLYDRMNHFDEANQAYRVDQWHAVPFGYSKASPAGTLSPGDNWVTMLREHDKRGLVTRVINDNNHVTTHTYDNARRPKIVTDPTGNQVEYAYDANGNVLALTETALSGIGGPSQTFTTTYTYDEEDRLKTQTVSGKTTTWDYDGHHNTKKVTDPLGNEVTTLYDHADRPWVTEHEGGIQTTTHWDHENRPLRRCDALDECTAYTYVPATRLVKTESHPTLPDVMYGYDGNGNQVTATYESGKGITMTYNELDRPTTLGVSGVATPGTTLQTFTYDALGRITQATDNGIGKLGGGIAASLPQIAVSQRFDTLGRAIEEIQLGLPVRHVLDGVGNVRSTQYPSPDHRVVSRSFDDAERLDRLWDTKGLIADHAYLGLRVEEEVFGGSLPSPPATGTTSPIVRSTFTYDALSRPVTIQHNGAAGTTLVELKARFDDAGNRAGQKFTGTGTTDYYSQIYTFDDTYRTTAWEQGPINAALDDIPASNSQSTWPSIDDQSDWVTWTKGGTTCTRTTTTTGTPAVRQVGDACPGGKTYTYDADGNLRTDGTYTYVWDFLNRLVRVDDASGNLVAGFGYDVFGRRIVKVFPENSAPGRAQPCNEAWYTYTGSHVIQEGQPCGSILPTTVPPTPPSIHVIRQWVYGNGVDKVLAMDVDANQNGLSAIDSADERYFYTYDAGNNVLGLLDDNGNMVEGYAYQPYGDPTVLVPAVGASSVKWDGTDTTSTGSYCSGCPAKPYSPSGNIWFFTGRQYDPEIGSYHYRARQYEPVLGQFMNPDPAGAWTDPMNLGNAYVYVGNNPGSWRDPWGNYACKEYCERLQSAGDGSRFDVDRLTGPDGETFAYRIGEYCFNEAGESLGRIYDKRTPECNHGRFIHGSAFSMVEYLEILEFATTGGILPVAKTTVRHATREAIDESVERTARGVVEESVERFAREAAQETSERFARESTEAVMKNGPGAGEKVLPTPRVSSPKLQNMVDDLYKGTTNPNRIGTGTTADAIRHELATGQNVFGRSHMIKGTEYSNGLSNWLRQNPGAPYHDRLVGQSLLDDLTRARGGIG